MNVEVELKEHIQSTYCHIYIYIIIIFSTHKGNLHRRVTIQMTKLRPQYWIPTLRNLLKFIIRNCRACQKYQATSYPDPKPGPLTKGRAEKCFSFQVIGVDYASPIFYRLKTRKDLKAYIIFHSCSVCRAVYLELLPNLGSGEFARCLKRVIASRRRPEIIYSDSAKTFKAGSKLLQKINKDEKCHHNLNQKQIT